METVKGRRSDGKTERKERGEDEAGDIEVE